MKGIWHALMSQMSQLSGVDLNGTKNSPNNDLN